MDAHRTIKRGVGQNLAPKGPHAFAAASSTLPRAGSALSDWLRRRDPRKYSRKEGHHHLEVAR
jgi:hypothetical protein